MERNSTLTLSALALAVVLASCSGGDRAGDSGPRGGIGIAAGTAPDEARLMRLIDERVALALGRDRAVRVITSGRARLRETLAEASEAARAPVEGSGARTPVAQLQPTAQELEQLAREVDDALAPDSDLRGFAQRVQAAMDGLGAVAGSVAADAGALVEMVRGHISTALSILDDVARARSSLAQIAGGKLPREEGYDLAGGDWVSAGYDTAGHDLGYGNSDATPNVPPEHVSDEPGAPALLAVIEHDDHEGLHAEVYGFDRTAGGTLTLKLAVVNDTGGEVSLIAGNLFGQGPHTWNLREVALIDPATGQRYQVMTDSDGNVLTSAGGHGNRMLAVGERRELWARFAALPPELTRVTLAIRGFPLIDHVPLPR